MKLVPKYKLGKNGGVSIPERVLEALKLEITIPDLAAGGVSIPERVLEALKQQSASRD